MDVNFGFIKMGLVETKNEIQTRIDYIFKNIDVWQKRSLVAKDDEELALCLNSILPLTTAVISLQELKTKAHVYKKSIIRQQMKCQDGYLGSLGRDLFPLTKYKKEGMKLVKIGRLIITRDYKTEKELKGLGWVKPMWLVSTKRV